MDVANQRSYDRLMEGRAPGSLDAASLEREPTYAESVRRFHERRREEILRDHLGYHERMIEAHTRAFEEILSRHREGAEECGRMLSMVVNESNYNERKEAS